MDKLCKSPRESKGDTFNARLSPLLRRGLVQLCFVIVLAAIAHGQTTGGLKGKIKNMNGQGIGGATVTVRLNGKELRTVTANGKGDFAIDSLESGFYDVLFDANGYAAAVKYNIEVKSGKTKDLGSGLILMEDRGLYVIVEGSVYYKDGMSLSGAEVKVERINGDGSTKNIRTMYTNGNGEVAFRQAQGKAKFRFTATHKGVTGSKELEVETAARYRFSIILDVEREKNPTPDL